MKKYFTIFTLLLVTEIAIAVFHFHNWIRYYLGDVLVIPLLYCLVRMVSKLSVKAATIIVLCIAFISEILQYLQIDKFLKIKNEIILILIGTSFSYIDLIAYALGIIPIYFIEKFRTQKKTIKPIKTITDENN